MLLTHRLTIRSLPRRLRRLRRLAATAPMLLLPVAARAQAVAGSVDPNNGLATIAPWILGLAGSAIVVIAMYKGVHAVAEGRTLGPTLVGMVSGLALAFGGYYVLQHYGVSTT